MKFLTAVLTWLLIFYRNHNVIGDNIDDIVCVQLNRGFVNVRG